ncbi:hypothetical protein ACRS5S_05740 [Nocardia asiatica]|uniref:hypothetical protein n=1 Tax=Nocardia asiatica TaxID=209252 RepID=UPI003EDF417D
MSSSPAHPARDTIPVGDVELHDNYLPGVTAGDYTVEVTHDLQEHPDGPSIITDGALRTVQRFTVRGPQVSIDTGAVLATQPPDGSIGRFAEVLPHVVLGDPMLPWERDMNAAPGTPWLALLVLTDDQLVGAAAEPTRALSGTVQDFLAPDTAVRKPTLVLESDIAPDAPCRYIQVATQAFRAVAPRLDEARWLTHCRGVNTGDRPVLGIQEDGLFSVVVAGRFPAVGPPGSADAVKNIAHLVSLEGHQPILTEDPEFGGHTSVALLSLCGWTFWCQADRKIDFRELAEGLAHDPRSSEPAAREQMWLRLPNPYPEADAADARGQVARRIDDGYVALPYVTRSGESTYGWYRGPCTPVVPAATPQAVTATTADALIGYDPVWGSFDLSLATAFGTGRALAIADSVFAQQLMTFKRAARALVDTLHNQDISTHLPDPGDGTAKATTAQAAFGAMLDGRLLTVLGGPTPAPTRTWSPPTSDTQPRDPAQALSDFLRSADTRTALNQALREAPLADELAPIVNWLAQRLLLLGIPFTHLVPDERMLPTESLRFFHIDRTWLDALVSGALSVGAQSSRDTVQDQIVGAAVRSAAATQATTHRDTLRSGVFAEKTQAAQQLSGFLLRSAIVSGWPNLAVRGYDPAGGPLRILRLDQLSPTVLLCLFDGIPHTVELAEPQEGFRFGVDDEGLIPLRNLRPHDSAHGLALGAPFDPEITFPVLDHLRGDDSCRVLAPGSLVAALGQALDAAHGTSVGPITPADLALQMVRVPEAIRFTGPTDQTEGR